MVSETGSRDSSVLFIPSNSASFCVATRERLVAIARPHLIPFYTSFFSCSRKMAERKNSFRRFPSLLNSLPCTDCVKRRVVRSNFCFSQRTYVCRRLRCCRCPLRRALALPRNSIIRPTEEGFRLVFFPGMEVFARMRFKRTCAGAKGVENGFTLTRGCQIHSTMNGVEK